MQRKLDRGLSAIERSLTAQRFDDTAPRGPLRER
jgi:hypothetical protein